MSFDEELNQLEKNDFIEFNEKNLIELKHNVTFLFLILILIKIF